MKHRYIADTYSKTIRLYAILKGMMQSSDNISRQTMTNNSAKRSETTSALLASTW